MKMVRDQIENNPEEFNMQYWGVRIDDWGDLCTSTADESRPVELVKKENGYLSIRALRERSTLWGENHYSGCKTAACIAGWAVAAASVHDPKLLDSVLKAQDYPIYALDSVAAMLLGLTDKPSYAGAHPLFFHGRWPSQYAAEYQEQIHKAAVELLDVYLNDGDPFKVVQ